MNVPYKVYVNFPFGERHPERGPMVTRQGLNKEDTEYICADAFIEKARNYLNDKLLNYIEYCRRGVGVSTEEFIEEFLKTIRQ